MQIFGAVFHFSRAPVEDVLDVRISLSFVLKYYTLVEEYHMFLCSHVPYEILKYKSHFFHSCNRVEGSSKGHQNVKM